MNEEKVLSLIEREDELVSQMTMGFRVYQVKKQKQRKRYGTKKETKREQSQNNYFYNS